MFIRWLLIALVLAHLPALSAAQEPLTGSAIALDGDTLALTDKAGVRTKIRLWGVDAPEMSNWPWGPRARAALDDLIRPPRAVLCHSRGRSHDRVVALCVVLNDDGEPLDLSKAMIESGYAVEYRSFTGGQYRAAEHAARVARRGVWSAP